MVFRRLEAVYVQAQLGSIEQEMTAGFERSAIPVLLGPGGSEWWKTAKSGFSVHFSAHVDAHLASGNLQSIHPGLFAVFVAPRIGAAWSAYQDQGVLLGTSVFALIIGYAIASLAYARRGHEATSATSDRRWAAMTRSSRCCSETCCASRWLRFAGSG
jgi:hypothetical protein